MDKSAPKKRKIRRLNQHNVTHNGTADEENNNLMETTNTRSCDAMAGTSNIRNDMGTIKRIVLQNFLCHEHLDFDNFSKNVNFLKGKNGSGKSAIVTAIIVGLGGSTKATDRGNSFKGLIQNGKNTATITIYLRNKGNLSYKLDVFGSTIIIERKLNVSGVNTFKIKSANGTLLSTKKQFLTKILDWFSIQVDNPIIILSQERAKTFLSSTDPKDLFNFYMKSTFLMQLDEDIQSIKKDINLSNNSIDQNSSAIPEMRKEVKRWKDKRDRFALIKGKVSKIEALTEESFWAEVQDAENKFEKLQGVKEKSESNSNLCKENLTKCQAEKKNLDDIKKITDENVSQLVEKSKQNEKEQKEHDALFQKVKTHFRFESNKMKTLQRELSDKQRDIEDLKSRLDKDYDEAKSSCDKNNQRIADDRSLTEEEIQSIKDRMDVKQMEISHIKQTINKATEDFKYNQLEQKSLKSRLYDIRRQLNQLQSVKNSLGVFGEHMPKIVEEIESASLRRVFTKKPIGPLGRHIKVKDPKWAHIAEQVLMSCITSFLVDNNSDYQQLKMIFNKIIPQHEFKPNVIICRYRNEMHDFRRFMTETPDYQSLFSILDIDNIHVTNTILDQTSCEGILLIPTSEHAIYLLSEQSRVPSNCSMVRTLNGDTIYPDPNYRIYSGNRDKRVKYLQVSLEDKMRDLQENDLATNKEVHNFNIIINAKTKELDQLTIKKNKSLKESNEFEKALKGKYNWLEELKNQELPPPPDVYQLQQDLKELEGQESSIQEKITSIQVDLKVIGEDKKHKEKSVSMANQEGKDIQEEVQKIQKTVSDTLESLKFVKTKTLAFTRKLQELEISTSRNIAEVNEREKIVNEKLAFAAEKTWERVRTRRSVEEIHRDIAALRAAVATMEKETGDMVSVGRQYNKKQEKLTSIETELKFHNKFIEVLNTTYKERLELLGTNKDLMRAALTSEFVGKIGNKGFTGKVDVDYIKKTIKILIKKSKLKENDPYQSIKMMSGGERSFATVSFIVALWGIVGSPIYVMDEFDIFMDCVSKTQCLDIIMNTVKKTQYILISPQEYQLDKNIHTFRMPDPVRGLTQPMVEDNDED